MPRDAMLQWIQYIRGSIELVVVVGRGGLRPTNVVSVPSLSGAALNASIWLADTISLGCLHSHTRLKVVLVNGDKVMIGKHFRRQVCSERCVVQGPIEFRNPGYFHATRTR